MNNWYTNTHEDSAQGLVIEEETGRNVAVTYDPKDAKLVAAALELLQVVYKFLDATDYDDVKEVGGTPLDDAIRAAFDVLYKFEILE